MAACALLVEHFGGQGQFLATLPDASHVEEYLSAEVAGGGVFALQAEHDVQLRERGNVTVLAFFHFRQAHMGGDGIRIKAERAAVIPARFGVIAGSGFEASQLFVAEREVGSEGDVLVELHAGVVEILLAGVGQAEVEVNEGKMAIGGGGGLEFLDGVRAFAAVQEAFAGEEMKFWGALADFNHAGGGLGGQRGIVRFVGGVFEDVEVIQLIRGAGP